jgi:hypothetical protein
MVRSALLAIAIGFALGCAAPSSESSRAAEPSRARESVPLCGALDSLAPPPDGCGAGELDEFTAALSARVREPAGRVLVRVELDDQSRVGALCVGPGPGYGPASAQRALAEQLAAIRALPPGPACAAGKRIDLNRYEAKWAQVHEREARCDEQTRVTRETQGPTRVRERTVPGSYGVYDREYEHCMDYQSDWIVLDAPGSTRPAIWVKPEIPNPPGPDAYETATRCKRLSRVFEKRAACIEADGWERLEPSRR